jgi:hypothetical protein
MVRKMVKLDRIKLDKKEEKIVDLSKDLHLRQAIFQKKRLLVKLSAFLLGVIVLLSISSPIAYADDDDGSGDDSGDDELEPKDDLDDDGVDDDIEDDFGRNVVIERESHEIEITSTLRDGEQKDVIEIEFRAEGEIEIEFAYKKQVDEVENTVKPQIKFRELIEFNDTNGNDVFDQADDVISEYDLGDVEYDPITYVTRNTLDNQTEHVFTAQTTDGIFKIVLHVVGEFAKIDSGTITPTEVKIDILIENFPFTQDETLVALETKVETEFETELDDETFDEEEDLSEDEEEIEIKSGDVTAYYSWSMNATIDGVSLPVGISNATDEEGDFLLYFAYAQGQVIDHDPKLGVPYSSITPLGIVSPQILPYIIALAVGAIVIGLAVFWRRKKNGAIGRNRP